MLYKFRKIRSNYAAIMLIIIMLNNAKVFTIDYS